MIKHKAEVILHCRWRESGCLAIWGEAIPNGVINIHELKNMLFAWHAPSFYGTMIEADDRELPSAILLTAEQALDFICHFPALQHVEWHHSSEIDVLFRSAPLVQQALHDQKYMPDYQSWLNGRTGWKLDLPEDIALLVDHSPDAKRWVEALVAARRDGRQASTTLWPDLDQFRHLTSRQWMDEEDWLIAIGWKHNPVPFRTCLQLNEPQGMQDGWRLQIVLQDRTSRDILLAWAPDIDVADYPEHWQEHIDYVHKKIERWNHLLPWLTETNSLRKTPKSEDRTAIPVLRHTLTNEEAWRFLTEGSIRLIHAGDTVLLPAWWERIRHLKPKIHAKVKSSIGTIPQSVFGLSQIMQFDWRIAIGDQEISEEEMSRLIALNKPLVQYNGQWIHLDHSMFQHMQRVMDQLKDQKKFTFRDVLHLHLTGEKQRIFTTHDEEDEHNIELEVELNNHVLDLVAYLSKTAPLPPGNIPDTFHGTLRPYQVEGMKWMLFLRKFGLGGCLADDMGLGKTIQWITYLLAVKQEEQPATPSLLICPTSVIGNWQKELQRFAPNLKVHLQYGPERPKGKQFTQQIRGSDLVITSYTLAHLDQEELEMVEWNSICLDEAQNIKNAYTKQASAIRGLDGHHRIAMTGTPIENRLTELWSIFDFINPGYLGKLNEFNRIFVAPVEKERDEQKIEQLQQLIQPFLLRREKKDPAIQLDLPEKHESKVFVSLTAEQGSLYESYIRDMFEKIDDVTVMERRGMILGALTRLKQLCNHPALLLKENVVQQSLDRSNKTKRLMEMIEELRAENDACLIFTQFVESGFMLQNMIRQHLGEDVEFLHGGTPRKERDTMISRFQDGDYKVFILSLKAGGIGLNLTAANHVFHFDRWWNPAVENQATDRAFRIGQTRHVQVHKFVTLGTLEEKIDEIIETKLGLSEQIVGSGEGWITEMSTEALRSVLSLRNEWITH